MTYEKEFKWNYESLRSVTQCARKHLTTKHVKTTVNEVMSQPRNNCVNPSGPLQYDHRQPKLTTSNLNP